MRELAGPAGVEFVPIHPENGMELDTLSQAEDVAGVYLQERPLIAETLQRGEVPLLSANPNDRQLASVVAFNATYAPPRLRGD